ncbi:MAG: ROK family protein [Bacteroidetes bacterium]|nr:ROK family protein [Bacteroidota bacterium]
MKKFAIGADIGGSHISCAVIDLEKKTILKETYSTQKVDNQASADDILKNWTIALGTSLMNIDTEQLAGIGFAMPGPFDYEIGVALFERVAKYESLYGINVAHRIADILALDEGVGIRFMNDASAFATGEAWVGKASNVDRTVCLTLGTGFGSAFVDKGVVVVERDDVPEFGCVWHLPFKDGIADDSFSTRWFIKRYFDLSNHQTAGVKEIADRIDIDVHAKEVFKEYGQNMGEFLAPWLLKFGTQALVMGGNVTGAYNLFGPYLEDALKKQHVNIQIHISDHMEDAAILGSARMFDPTFWERIKPMLAKM